MTIIELKAEIYDNIAVIEKSQARIRDLNICIQQCIEKEKIAMLNPKLVE